MARIVSQKQLSKEKACWGGIRDSEGVQFFDFLTSIILELLSGFLWRRFSQISSGMFGP